MKNKLIYSIVSFFLASFILIDASAQTKNTNLHEEDGKDTVLVGRIQILIRDYFRAPVPYAERIYFLKVRSDEAQPAYKIIFGDKGSPYLSPNVTAEIRGIVKGWEIYVKEIRILK